MPLSETFILIRHGESDANSRDVISDKNIDTPLTDQGIAQAHETARLLKGEQIDLVISSTRQRARITGEIINEFHNAKMILTDDLIERDYGIFGGMDKTRADEMMVRDGFDWLNIPESETVAEIDHRVAKVVAMIAQKYAGARPLISTHEDIVRSFYRVVTGVTAQESMQFEIDNSQPHYLTPKT